MGATLITTRQVRLPSRPGPPEAAVRMPWPNRAGAGRREARQRLACALACACCLEGALVAGAWWLDRPRSDAAAGPQPRSVDVVFVPVPSAATAAVPPADIAPADAPAVAETSPAPEAAPAPPAELVPAPALAADPTLAPAPPLVAAPTAAPAEVPLAAETVPPPLPTPVLPPPPAPQPSAPSRRVPPSKSPASARPLPAPSPRSAERPGSSLPALSATAGVPASAQPQPDPGEISTFEGRIRQAVQAALRVPPAVRIMGLSGRTGVAFSYRDGAVDAVAVTRSAGAALLDGAALAAVRTARYPRPPENVAGKTLRLLVWVDIAPGPDGE